MANFFKRDNDYQVAEIKRMQALYESGRLSRRNFMQGMLAAGLTATTAGAVLTGSMDVQAATPKKGGRLRFAWDQHGPADTTDPTLFTSSLDYIRGRAYYNNLVRFNDDLTVGPELATEWDVSDDGLTYTFKLRRGVKFHDGKDFTADDVVYTMMRHHGEASKSKAKSLVTMVTEWKKTGSHEVQAILDSPNADLPAILGTFHFKVIQNGGEGEYFQKPVGTGPFVCKEFTPGVRSMGVRNDNYWNDEGGPYLDELETFAITDTVSRVNALISGDVHVIGNADPKAYKQIEGTDGVELYSVPSGAYMDIVCMRDRAPGDSNDFVLALKYLQRRKRIVRSILKGHGTVGNDHPISPAYAEHCKDLEQRPYDPDKAKFHLKKSGVTKTELEVAEVGPGLTDMCLMLQREAKKIGLDLNVKRVPGDGYWGAVWMKKPIHVSSWNMRPTGNVMLTLAYAPNAPWNESQYSKSERMGELLAMSRAEQDQAKRGEMFCEMQKIVRDEYGTIIPVHRNYVDAIRSNVKGMTKVPLAGTGGMEWPEYAWLA